MDSFDIVYRILRYLEKAMDYDEADLDFISARKFGITEQRWTAILEMMVTEGYIEGVEVKRSVGGDIALSVSAPRITFHGLEYLKENSLMKKAAETAKGISAIVH